MKNSKAKVVIIVILIILLLICLGVICWQYSKIKPVENAQNNSQQKISISQEPSVIATNQNEPITNKEGKLFIRDFDKNQYIKTIELSKEEITSILNYSSEKESIKAAGLGIDYYKIVIKDGNVETKITIHGDGVITYNGEIFECEKLDNYVFELTKKIDVTKYTNKANNYSISYPSDLGLVETNKDNVTIIQKDKTKTLDTDVTQIYTNISAEENEGSMVKINEMDVIYSTAEARFGYTYYTYQFKIGTKYLEIRLNKYPEDNSITLDMFENIVKSLEIK